MTRPSIAIACLAVAALWCAPPAGATEALGAKEEVACTSCHDKPGSKLLTDQGKYYELMRTFDGYDEVTSVFGACTSCHVRKPGALHLTAQGRRFERLVRDMEGLRAFLAAQHPKAPPAEQEPPPDEEQPVDGTAPDEEEAEDGDAAADPTVPSH